MALTAADIRLARDRIIRFVYENGAGEYEFCLDINKVRAGAGVDSAHFDAALGLMSTQNLIGGWLGGIGLNERGQIEAERIGPLTAMRAPEPQGPISVSAHNSTVQIAGHHSMQTAMTRIDNADVAQLIAALRAELPTLPLTAEKRAEASELVDALEGAAASGKLTGAVAKLAAQALSSILTGAGSAVGKSLVGLLPF